MSKLVTNDNLKAYHAELAEHIKLLQRNTAYALNDIVSYDGKTLKCTTAGTTDTTRPNILTLSVGSTYTDGTCVWTRIDLDKRGIDYYVASKDYEVDDQVVYNNNIYRCITAHTSTSTFDSAKWTEISAGGSSSRGGISIWQANTAYNVNDVVIDSNLIWQCATAHTSTTTFDESKWICISGGEISNGLEIVDLWSGTFSFDNSTQGSAPTSSTPTIELSDSIQNYEYLLVGCGILVNNVVNNQDSIITPISVLSSGGNLRVSIAIADSEVYSAVLGKYDNTHLYMRWKAKTYDEDANIISVQGIRKAKPIVSSGMKYETLYMSSTTLSNEDFIISLAEPIDKYKKIGFTVLFDVGDEEQLQYFEVSSSSLIEYTNNTLQWGYVNTTQRIGNLQASSASTIEGHCYGTHCITKIIGISEGVQIPTGVQAARVTLFEGNHTSSSNITISDDYTNYDELEFYCGTAVGSRYDYIVAKFSKQELDNTLANNTYCIILGFNGENREIQATNDKKQFVLTTGMPIYKIVGIKYIQPDSYSTEEKLIGTWIDGKPLYRKVFTGTAPSSADVNTNIFTDPLFTNVDMCYVKDGYIKRDAGSGDIDFYKINESMDSDYRSRIFISGSESSIRGAVGQRLTSSPLVVIVEYTKN